MGNPTEYKGNELKWTRVRQLASYGSNTFQYGADGIRCKKNETDYILSGSRILKENRGTVSLTYYYGLSGVIGFQYDAEDYFYQKNLQGDITGIYTSNGTLVAEYKYDAWGKVLAVVNHTSANIGDLNPFRYRGYYYDTETGLYYLQSRYYDPEIGRFINADAFISTGQGFVGNNMFAYCLNNPVVYRDSHGNYPEWSCDSPAAAVGRQIGEWLGNWLREIIETYPTEEEHYNRNANNPKFPKQYNANYFDGWDDNVSANCHQFTSQERNNKKYVSPDGKYEAIYDVKGHLVEDPRDVGTYNFISPNKDPIGHIIVDVVPWIWHGNSPHDTTEWYERALSFLGIHLN